MSFLLFTFYILSLCFFFFFHLLFIFFFLLNYYDLVSTYQYCLFVVFCLSFDYFFYCLHINSLSSFGGLGDFNLLALIFVIIAFKGKSKPLLQQPVKRKLQSGNKNIDVKEMISIKYTRNFITTLKLLPSAFSLYLPALLIHFY